MLLLHVIAAFELHRINKRPVKNLEITVKQVWITWYDPNQIRLENLASFYILSRNSLMGNTQEAGYLVLADWVFPEWLRWDFWVQHKRRKKYIRRSNNVIIVVLIYIHHHYISRSSGKCETRSNLLLLFPDVNFSRYMAMTPTFDGSYSSFLPYFQVRKLWRTPWHIIMNQPYNKYSSRSTAEFRNSQENQKFALHGHPKLCLPNLGYKYV